MATSYQNTHMDANIFLINMSIKHNKAKDSSFYISNCIAKGTQSCTRILHYMPSALIPLIDYANQFKHGKSKVITSLGDYH